MAESQFALLDHRAVLAIAGDDRRTFLQGLITNDIARVTGATTAYAALLTPQGKFLHDMFIGEMGDTLLIEAEAARLTDLRTRLSRFRLRAKVTLAEVDDFAVAAAFGPGAPALGVPALGVPALGVPALLGLPGDAGSAAPFAGGVAGVDPRLAEAGVRIWAPRDGLADVLTRMGLAQGTARDYDRHRLALGLPDGSRDMVVEKSLPLECGFEELNGVDFKKGCYMGQELTARTKYRGLVKKRLMPVRIDGGPPPDPGTPIMHGDREAGEMRSGADGTAIALIRLEYLAETASFTAGDTRVIPWRPSWLRLPDPS